MDATLALYRALGLTFTPEQHGSGPVHHSCDLGGTVLEIYPGSDGNAPDRKAGGATTLGLRVASIDALLPALNQLGTPVILPPKNTPWGQRAAIADPDGRAVEIYSSNGNPFPTPKAALPTESHHAGAQREAAAGARPK